MYSQNSPTPPVANAGVTDSGITYSFASTSNSLALSCVFNESNYEGVLSAIRTEYPDFTSGNVFTPEDNKDFKSKIELKKSSLKLEYKILSDKENTNAAKIERISSKILDL